MTCSERIVNKPSYDIACNSLCDLALMHIYKKLCSAKI